MKKFAVIVMVLVMVFALSATAFGATYSDVSSLSQNVQDSIGKVSALAIFQGDGDGTFRPSDTITRAEFAKVACVAAGLGTSGDALINTPSQFTDVKAGEWWTGWINLAVAQGYMKGDPNGTFRPKDPITMAEVTTVLLRMLGYNDNLPGLWPVDYIAQAGKLDLFDNVTFSSSAPATRSQVAVMIDNDLSQKLVVWDTDKTAFENKSGNPTLLSDSFKGQTATVTFANGSINSQVDAWKYSGVNKDNLQLVYAVNAGGAPADLADDYAISGGNTLQTLAGQQADVIYDKDADGDANEVIYVDVTSRVVTTTSISKVTSTSDPVVTAGVVTTAGTVYINNVKYTIPVGIAWAKNTSQGTRIVFDKDDNVLEGRDIAANGVNAQLVDQYNATAKRIEYKPSGSLALSSKSYLFFKDGKAAAITDLEENDTVIAFANACGFDYVIYASSPVTGVVSAVSSGDTVSGDKVTVAGKSYYLAVSGSASKLVFTANGDDFSNPNAAAIATADVLGETAQYALGSDNKLSVLAFSVDAKDSVYGVISAVDSYNFNSKRITELTICNAAGEFVTYELDNSDGSVALYNNVATLANTSTTGSAAGFGVCEGMLIKARLTDDGKIDQITKAKAGVSGGDVDKDNKRLEIKDDSVYYKVASAIAAFDITMEDGISNSVDDVDTITYDALFSSNTVTGSADSDNTNLDTIQYFVNDDNIITAVAALDYAGTTSNKFGVVKSNAYYTGTSRLVQFYGFDSSDFTFKLNGLTAPTNKSVVAYTTSGTSLSSISVLFTPANSDDSIDTAINFHNIWLLKSQDINYYAGDAEAVSVVTGTANNADACAYANLNSLGSTLLSGVSNDQFKITADDSATAGVVETAFLLVDSDTQIYDYSSFTDISVGDTPAKLTAADLTSGMTAIVFTSNDTDKDGRDSIAQFIIVLSK